MPLLLKLVRPVRTEQDLFSCLAEDDFALAPVSNIHLALLKALCPIRGGIGKSEKSDAPCRIFPNGKTEPLLLDGDEQIGEGQTFIVTAA